MTDDRQTPTGAYPAGAICQHPCPSFSGDGSPRGHNPCGLSLPCPFHKAGSVQVVATALHQQMVEDGPTWLTDTAEAVVAALTLSGHLTHRRATVDNGDSPASGEVGR